MRGTVPLPSAVVQNEQAGDKDRSGGRQRLPMSLSRAAGNTASVRIDDRDLDKCSRNGDLDLDGLVDRLMPCKLIVSFE
jgi:hypothetical protein